MTLDLATAVQLLGSGKVVGLGIGEVASLHVLDVHHDLERGVRLDSGKVRGVDEFGGGHVVDRGNGADWGGIARAGLDLLSIGDREVGDGQAEVDEVVGRSQGPDLAIGRDVLAVIGETLGNDFRIES